MRNVPTLDLCRKTMRTQVCTKCPYRSRGAQLGPDFDKPCEKECPLFVHLRILHEVARQTDPMVGHRPRVLHDLVLRIMKRWHGDHTALREHVQRVVNVFEKLFSV